MARFPKKQRKLSPRTQADLYQNGNVVFHYPYKVFYLMPPAPVGTRLECNIVVSVPKRNFKRAVDRNRIKRQMREAFRLNAGALRQTLIARDMHIRLLCLYLPHEHAATSLLSRQMGSLLARLTRLAAQAGAVPDAGTD